MGHIFHNLAPDKPHGAEAQAAKVYLCAAFFGLPLVLWNGFFAVTESKACYFVLISALYLIALGPIRLKNPLPGGPGRPAPERAAFLMYCGVFLLSALVSEDPMGAIVAADNRYQGIVTIVLYAGAYLALSSTDGLDGLALSLLTAAFVLTAALGIFNHLGADPLGTLGALTDFDRGRYVSTFGNINFFGAYLVLFTPVFFCLALLDERRSARVFFIAVAALGAAAALAARSESTVLGLAAGLLIAPLLLPEAGIKRLGPLALVPLLAMQGMGLLSGLCGAPALSKLMRIVLSPAVFGAAAAILIALWALTARADAGRIAKARRVYGRGLILFAGLMMLAILLFSTVWKGIPLPGALSYLRIDEGWGTDRGGIWKFCLEAYADYPLGQKLIGGGPGCLARIDAVKPHFADALIDSAHNEYLHTLLTSGALGLVAYLAFLGLTVREGLRHRDDPLTAALLLGAIAYMAQAAVNIAQPATTPLFLIALAALGGRMRRMEEP